MTLSPRDPAPLSPPGGAGPDGGKVERPGALPAATAPDGIVTPWSRLGHPSPRMARGEAAAPSLLPPAGGGAAQSSGTHQPRPGSVPDPSPPRPSLSTRGDGGGTREEGPGGLLRPAAGSPPALDPPRAVPDETAPSGPAVRGGSTWTIELPAGLSLLSLNRHLHWAKHQAIGEGIRDAAIVLARKARIPPLKRARIIAEYQPPTARGRRDADNIPVASAKWAVDGLVRAGVLPDDACPKYVEAIEGRVGEPYPRGRLRIIIREVGVMPPDGAA